MCALLLISLLAFGREKRSIPPSKHAPVWTQGERIHAPNERRTLDDAYMSTDVPKPIPDLGTVESVLNVSATDSIHSIAVYVDITHSWVRDLIITLYAPGDTVGVLLLTELPLDDITALQGWFDDAAAVSILQAAPPLVGGTWRPVQPLSHDTSRTVTGTWRLRIQDQFRLDTGTLNAWGIEINPEVRLTGTIINSLTRDPVEGAVIESIDDGVGTRTLRNGTFTFSRIGYGTHTLRLRRTDYDTLLIPGVVVEQGTPGTLDTAMSMRPNHFEFVSRVDPVLIPDSGQSYPYAYMPINVRQNIVIDSISCTVTISHDYVSDLVLWLQSPLDCVSVMLADRPGGVLTPGAMTECTFDDRAATSITTASPPFAGHFRPAEPLTAFQLDSTQGMWKLVVADTSDIADGNIEYYSLRVIGHYPESQLRVTVRNKFSRQPVPDAKIEFVEWGQYATTDGNGYRSFRPPESQPQTVRITKANYDTLIIPGVVVPPTITVYLDTALTMPPDHFEFDSPPDTVRIPDSPDSIATLDLPIGQDVVIDTLTVKVNITHRRDSDLSIWLKSPLDSMILLASHVNSDSANFIQCVFDDFAADSIGAGRAPFTGRYRPLQLLSLLNGDTARGNWQLIVQDSVDSLAGKLNSFSLHIVGRWIDLPAVDEPGAVVQKLEFYPNYPNPFNSRTEFRFDIPRSGLVTLALYNVLGQKVAELTHGVMDAGSHRLSFDAGGLTSGIYFARLQAAGSVQCRKIVLLR
jgi:subtilisin-like proprotein convertase family protein